MISKMISDLLPLLLFYLTRVRVRVRVGDEYHGLATNLYQFPIIVPVCSVSFAGTLLS